MRSADRRNAGRREQQIWSNAAYGLFGNRSHGSTSRDASGPRPNVPWAAAAGSTAKRRVTDATTTSSSSGSSSSSSYLQRSASADDLQIVRQRGFKPSDRHDPAKRNFLESLTSKILHFDMESGHSTPIDLQKLLTPATDSSETLHVRNKKMYASSYFYSPSHPTVEDQVELARRISSSLSDVKNVKSKGQSMYVNRKKRSVKWIHDGNGQEDEQEEASPINKEKIPLKCMMNPGGKLLDYHGIQALGEDPNIPQVPPHPERLYDIVRDLNNQKGRGAEIFAKRRKRSEKWVVDAEPPQSPSIYGYGKAPVYPTKQDIGVNENLKFDNKALYNPFDLSMDYSNAPLPNCGHQCSRASFSSAHSDCGPCGPCAPYGPYGHELKKIYLREVAVGTEPESLLRPRAAYGLGRPARNKAHQQNGPAHCQQRPAARANGSCHAHPQNGYSYLNGLAAREHRQPAYAGYPSRGGYQPEGAYRDGGAYPSANGCHNGNGYQAAAGHRPRAECQNGAGRRRADDSCEAEEDPAEDYTPVPVKQLIQEFEKTCRPVMQLKRYPARSAPASASQNDLSRYFESRREVVYQSRRGGKPEDQQQPRYRGNGYASSAGDDEEDEDDEDDEEDEEEDDASLDDSLSPVDLYRVGEPRPVAQAHAGNRSSSMTTLDEYYRRQLQQYQAQEDKPAKFANAEADVSPGARAANLAAVVTQREIAAQRKDLRKTPVLENLVAGTTTPECFKDKFTADIATKLSDNAYHGPKISSYQNLANYNTAPRGWDQSQSVYRPIRFEKPQDTKISYSDF